MTTLDRIEDSNPSWIGREATCSLFLESPDVVVVDTESRSDITVLVEDGLAAISLPAGRWWLDPVDGISLVTERTTLCEHAMREPRPRRQVVY